MLNNQQKSLLNAIFMQLPNHETSFEDKNGLLIYQRSLIANASKAMAITFATTHSFVGEVVFTRLVQQYLIEELRDSYDWGEFGVTFPNFIANQAIDNAALLASVATLDFFCHQSERSQNVETDLTSLNLLSSHDAYELAVELGAGTRVLSSKFQLDHIIKDMAELSAQQKVCTLNDVKERLSGHSANYLAQYSTPNSVDEEFYYLVWRPHFQAQYERISKAEFDWITLLINPVAYSLGQVLDLQASEDFSFVEWLPNAIQKKQINRISIVSSEPDK